MKKVIYAIMLALLVLCSPEEISKDEYDNMPGVPISNYAILEANGYHDWEPTLGK